MAKIQTSDGYMISKKSNQHPEGFSPIYKNGKITPDTQGLGPKLKDSVKIKREPLQRIPQKKIIEPIRKLKKLNIKNLA